MIFYGTQTSKLLTLLGIIVMIVGIYYSSIHPTKRFTNNRMFIALFGAGLSITGFLDIDLINF